MANRYSPRIVLSVKSPNQSSRGGVHPKLIVIHSTESDNRTGNGDLSAVANYLCRSSVQASCHVITDADGHSARVVPDYRKAWHCAGYNSVSLGIEQIGRAAQTHWTRDEIRETARWVARWAKVYGIPIRAGQTGGGRVVKSGVVTHRSLGSIGGGHSDPGSAYPMQSMLNLAKFYRSRI